MQTILERLQEMPYSMVVRVARKFRLDIHVNEERQSIISRLEEEIADYLQRQEQEKDAYIDVELSKYNLLSDFEVPYEIGNFDKPKYHYDEDAYIDIILRDNKWCYMYWNLSQYDRHRVLQGNIQELFIRVLYSKEKQNSEVLHFDYKEDIPIGLDDGETNFYPQYHYITCCCQVIAVYPHSSQTLAVSESIFLPHISSITERCELDSVQQELWSLALDQTFASVDSCSVKQQKRYMS